MDNEKDESKDGKITFRTAYKGPDGMMMLEKYLNDEEAEEWLKELEERNIISSHKDYKRYKGN